MNRNLFGKFFFVIFIVAWSLWSTYPPQARNLIDVFQERAFTRGDSNAVATVTAIVAEARKLDEASPSRTFANLRQATSTNDLTRFFPAYKVTGEADTTRAILQRLQQEAPGKIKLGLDLQGGTSFVVRMKPREQTDTNSVSRVQE